MNRNVVSLCDVGVDLFQGSAESLMSVWDMTEVAFDPLSLRWDVEGEGFGAVVSDL